MHAAKPRQTATITTNTTRNSSKKQKQQQQITLATKAINETEEMKEHNVCCSCLSPYMYSFIT